MRLAHWTALLLLVLSFACCMWIFAATAANVLLPQTMPEGARLSQGEVMIGALICLIAPFTLAGASGLTWWFGVRRRHSSTTVTQPVVPRAQPAFTPAAEVNERETAASALEQYLGQLSELWLMHVDTPTGSVRPQLQSLTRRVLATSDLVSRQRIVSSLQSFRLRLGDEPLNLYGLDLSGADLRFASLRSVNLAGVRLQGAQLTGADLRGADLSDCDLSGADLRLCCLELARLERANLSQARLQGASLRGARLEHAQLNQASLWQADLRDATVTRAQLATVASIEAAILPASIE